MTDNDPDVDTDELELPAQVASPAVEDLLDQLAEAEGELADRVEEIDRLRVLMEESQHQVLAERYQVERLQALLDQAFSAIYDLVKLIRPHDVFDPAVERAIRGHPPLWAQLRALVAAYDGIVVAARTVADQIDG